MNIKLIGSIMIILSCGGFGFRIAAAHRADMRVLRELIGVLDYMECELNYRLTPLPQLCRQAASESKRSIKPVLLRLAEEMDNQISPDIDRCMHTAIESCNSIPKETKECLLELGESLGKFDLNGQLLELKSVRNLCRRKYEALNTNKDVRLRSYQALGLCAGAAIAILLI